MAICSKSNGRRRWSPDAAMATDYDLAIVGAGPAGSVLALLAARQGMRVLLAERSRFDRRTIGETVPPEIKPLLGKLGLAHVLEGTHREASAVMSVWGTS